MSLTIVVLDKEEKFLEFLDEDLCTLTETIEHGGLRTLSFEYKFKDVVEDKKLFKIGNKLWVQGDVNLSDCLYVINTEVKQDIYQENSFKLELEEVLVELNYAPLFSQTELKTVKDSSNNSIFHTVSTNGKQEVVVDWNALNYWFGSFFNIGVVQKCISDYASRISITGTVNRMDLLRKIEEETGNVFVTRYEKDFLDNTIDRYLDFLNPINCQKDWSYHLEYDFNNDQNKGYTYDENGNITADDRPWEITRFENETINENRTEYPDAEEEAEIEVEDDYDTEVDEPYDEIANEHDETDIPVYFPPVQNLDPANCEFRITNPCGKLLNTNGEKYDDNDPEQTPLSWDCPDTGLDGEDYPSFLITLQKRGNNIGMVCNEKSYCIVGLGDVAKAFLPEIRESDTGYIACDTEIQYNTIPDNSYLQIYDHENDVVLFSTLLNTEIGTVHEEVLDFGFNLENIQYNVDEADTYSAVSPVLKLSEGSGDSKALTRSDMETIINRWISLDIPKGTIVPMIVEKINVKGTSLQDAQSKLGTFNRSSNYFIRPLKPTDNTDGNDKQYEFYRAIAYWKAPYTKHAGQLHVETDKLLTTEYTDIYTRPDTRKDRAGVESPKMGNTESTDEDVYAIYNQVCLYLKDHEDPKVELDVDIANLRGHEYNNYELHDKIYIRLPNTNELVTARITKTTKEAHDIAKNTVEISNYTNLNTIKTLTHATYIDAKNVNFNYPKSQNLKVRLVNEEPDEASMSYPANKLLTFTLYKIENQSRTFTGKVYTKVTDGLGYANVNLKYLPGSYEMDIRFVGDEEYEESEITLKIKVGGSTTTPQQDGKKAKIIKSRVLNRKARNNDKFKYATEYFNKCGVDKKKKKVASVAQPSTSDAYKYNYNQLYLSVFKNYCPMCGRKGTLRFDGGSKNACITSSDYGVNWKPSVPEHEITCIHCDSDYCGVSGLEKSNSHSARLKRVEGPYKSSKADFNKLVKGKLIAGQRKLSKKEQTKLINKSRKIRKKDLSKSVIRTAWSIVGMKTGWDAMDAIVQWFDKNISYNKYNDFKRSAKTVIRRGGCNCCDGTRAFFELCDAAGLCEFFNFYYVHVTCPEYGHVYGIVESKKTKKWVYVDTASDAHGCWKYVCDSCPHGGRSSKYPSLPF